MASDDKGLNVTVSANAASDQYLHLTLDISRLETPRERDDLQLAFDTLSKYLVSAASAASQGKPPPPPPPPPPPAPTA